MKYSRLLSPPTTVVILTDGLGRLESPALAFLAKRGDGRINDNEVTASLEFFIRKMVSACAFDISFPASPKQYWGTPERLKSLLSETAKNRLRFVDRRSSIWLSVKKYFEPLTKDLDDNTTNRSRIPDAGVNYDRHLLSRIAWNFYLLVLATYQQAEVVISPDETTRMIEELLSFAQLSRESQLRLATIEGVFALFEKNDEIPSFCCVRNRNVSFAERIDEILEDAYLLDASRLRRFLSLGANVAATKRDLRKIIRFIAKNRPWAKGLVSIASRSYLTASPTALMEGVFNILPDHTNDLAAPVILLPNDKSYGRQVIELEASRILFDSDNEWEATIKVVK